MTNSASRSNRADVIIVGGGGAGMCAALEVDHAGLGCILIEADEKLGGATALSNGIFYAAGTRHQERLGIVDSPDAMYGYIMALSQASARPDLVRILCDRGAEGLDFLMELGVSVPEDFVFGGGKDRVARGHSCSGDGGSIGAVLAQAVDRVGLDVRLNSRVTDMIVEDGRIVGVRVGDVEYRGDAVILTTGGFGNNHALIERFWPSMARQGRERIWAVHIDAPYILGDGLLLGESVGAGITGHDTGLPVPTAGFQRTVEGAGAIAPWSILVNLDGRRFMSETSPYSVSGYLVNGQPESRCYAIFDERMLREVADDLGFIDPHKQGDRKSSWDQASLRAKVAEGVIKTSGTLAELAAKLGMPSRALEATVARYNADVDHGVDRTYLKTTGLHHIREAPFYAVEMRAAVVGVTSVGLDIDSETRVLDRDGHVLGGLYAAGEVLGNSYGSRYPAGGISIATAVIFGRIAGQTAAADIRAASRTSVAETRLSEAS